MSQQGPFLLNSRPGNTDFPPPELAADEPNGLLAVGGDLSPQRLIAAYRAGIFPWYSNDQPILWWSPNPRAVLFPDNLKVSRSLRKTLRKKEFQVTLDEAFVDIIDACSQPRQKKNGAESGTWITAEMKQAYIEMHRLGYAHAVECRFEGELVGGLYGIAIGRVFFGESMFTRRSNASKVAFIHLVRQLQQWNFALIDCQVSSEHLKSLGAEDIPRSRFQALLEHYCPESSNAPDKWRLGVDEVWE